MNEILALKAKLAKVQSTKKGFEFTEKNCVDLLLYLGQRKLIDVVHTTYGKVYLTYEQLDVEILQAVDAAGGRLPISELPNHVEVAFEHCRSRAEVLANSKDKGVRIINDELVVDKFFGQVSDEIAKFVDEKGALSLADIASRYMIPSDIIKSEVFPLLSDKGFIVKPQVVYPEHLLDWQMAKLRGAMLGSSSPTPIKQFEERAFPVLVDQVLALMQKIIDDGEVRGRVHGGKFIPASFEAQQAIDIVRLMREKQYISLATLQNAGVVGDAAVLEWSDREKVGPGLCLGSVFVAEAVLTEAKNLVGETIRIGGAIDVSTILPFADHHSADCLLFCTKHLTDQNSTFYVPNCHLTAGIPVAFSTRLVENVAKHFRVAVEKAANAAPIIAGAQVPSEAGTKGSSKKSGGKKLADDAWMGGMKIHS